MNTTCEHGNMITHYQMNIYGCSLCDRALQDQYDVEDLINDNYLLDRYGSLYVAEHDRQDELIRCRNIYSFVDKFMKIHHNLPIIYSINDDDIEWEPHDFAYEAYLFSKNIKSQLIIEANKKKIQGYFKNLITEELIATVMHPSRIQAKIDLCDDFEQFFDTI